MIEIKGLVKRFDKTEALSGVNLCAPTGCVYGLIGPNGAGKSTLLRCLTGVYRVNGGTVKIDGADVYENETLKAKMHYIPDELYWFVSATAKELAKLYSRVYPSFDRARYEKLKEVFGLDEKRPVRLFSKGMQKQTAFWLALSCRPEILILDEPVDGLDPVMRRTVWNLVLQDVSERNMTVIVSSHNLRELEDVCDTVGLIDKGKMVLEHSLSDLQDDIVKLQIVTEGELDASGFDVLSTSESGKVKTLIVRGGAEEVSKKAEALSPVFYDILPISLEEIFIYELGGVDNAKKILL